MSEQTSMVVDFFDELPELIGRQVEYKEVEGLSTPGLKDGDTVELVALDGKTWAWVRKGSERYSIRRLSLRRSFQATHILYLGAWGGSARFAAGLGDESVACMVEVDDPNATMLILRTARESIAIARSELWRLLPVCGPEIERTPYASLRVDRDQDGSPIDCAILLENFPITRTEARTLLVTSTAAAPQPLRSVMLRIQRSIRPLIDGMNAIHIGPEETEINGRFLGGSR